MKIKHQVLAVLVYILLFSSSMLFSQEVEPVFEHVSIDLHTPNIEIRAIHQDKTGFIWFGALNGLHLYDGYKITIFTSNSNDNNSISDNLITKILETKDSTLWFGTGNGLNKYNPKDGKFKRYLHNPEDSTSIYNNSINGMVEDRYRNLWVITNSSISFCDITTQKFKNYIINNKNETFSFTSKPTSITIDSDGNLLVGYENSVLDYIFINDTTKKGILNSNTHYKRFHLNKSNNSEYPISCIYQSSDKKYWIGTEGAGFFSIDYENLKTALNSNVDKIEYNDYSSHFKDHNVQFPKTITDISEDKNHNIYLTSFGDGLYYYYPKYNSFKNFKYKQGIITSLNSNFLYSIHIDRSDNVWIGTYTGGATKYSPNKSHFEIYKTNNTPGLLRTNIVSAIYEDKEGILWAGSREGITRIDRKNKSTESFLYNPKGQFNTLANHIRSIVEDDKKRIWFGSRDGLHCFDKQSKKFIYNYNPQLYKLVAKNYIRALLHKDNILWVASYLGLIKYNLSNNQLIVYDNKPDDSTTLNDNHIWSLHLDKFNNIWIGNRKGLSLFDQKTEKFTPFLIDGESDISNNNIVVSIASDTNNVVWIATAAKGILYLTPSNTTNGKPDYSGSTFKPLNLPTHDVANTPNFSITGILTDSEQNVWFGTYEGIISYNINDSSFSVLDLTEFMMNNILTTGVYFRSESDEIFFGGNNGMVSFFPEKLKYNHNIPQVAITSIVINDSISYSETVAANRNEISLRYNDKNSIVISFATLEFTNPKYNYYMYMLEGYDKDWIESNERNIVVYMNLPPGTYMFKVMGSNNNRVWSDTSANLKITITPLFWQTTWFTIVSIIVVLAITYLIIKTRLKRIQEQKEKLEHEVEDRTAQLKSTNKMLEKEIIERVKIEKDIVKTNKLLVESNTVKDKLFSIISHDLKGSLGTFRDMSRVLVKELDSMDENELKEILEGMDESATSTYTLLETLLLWATNQQGEIEANVEEHDISQLIKSVGNNLQHIAKSKNINLSFDIEEGYIAKFDKNTMDIVVRNLTTNALKFTHPNGNVWYTVERQNSHIIVSVNDNGVGIPQDKIDKIFGASKTKTTSLGTKGEKGTGVGLMLCKDFVTKNGGTLWVESTPGKGSSFKFSLPTEI